MTTTELSEQIPLKQDTEADPSTTTIEGQTVESEQTPLAEITQAEKKKWWFRKNQKKAEKPEKVADGEKETGTEDNTAPAGKKPQWWQRKPCKGACEGTTFGVDFTRRDDNQLHTAIDLGFSDIFGEPDAIHSFNGVWRVTNSVFLVLFTLILCIPAAFLFGLLYALISALGVFCIIPAGRLLAIPAAWLFKLWSCVVFNVLQPIAAGIAHLFSQIKIFRYGINSDPTATLGA
ncbi:Caveolin domain containing protein, protein [Aphelenchoides besseyi]|nr:Caveolin domain containing protein, protein [Aphelenchoides besseyi]KAI6202084.1 Caveolin domain containing protein, protein [Aphelenchoides besseyi]